VAFPDPVRDPLTVIHDAPVVTVQAQVDDVVTAMVPVAPPGGAVTVNGETVNVQDAAASVTVKLLPAIVSVALLVAVVVFNAAVNLTLPEPLPVAPLVIVTHEAPLVAVQLHPAVVVTVTVPLPPDPASDWLVGEMVNAQGGPACVTERVLPATATVPVRDVVPVFDATLSVTVPPPIPAAPAVTAIHDALLIAVHVHPAAAVTVVLAVPPAADSDWLAGEMVGAQGAANEKVFERALAALPPGPTARTTDS
jgi:hypothetical protein